MTTNAQQRYKLRHHINFVYTEQNLGEQQQQQSVDKCSENKRRGLIHTRSGASHGNLTEFGTGFLTRIDNAYYRVTNTRFQRCMYSHRVVGAQFQCMVSSTRHLVSDEVANPAYLDTKLLFERNRNKAVQPCCSGRQVYQNFDQSQLAIATSIDSVLKRTSIQRIQNAVMHVGQRPLRSKEYFARTFVVTKSTNRLVTKSSSALQEKVKRDKLRTQLELESSERQEQIQRTFAKALQMQEKSVEEAAALKTELARKKENNEEKLQSLVEQENLRRKKIFDKNSCSNLETMKNRCSERLLKR